MSKPTMPNRRDGTGTKTLWRLSDGVIEAAGARTTKQRTTEQRTANEFVLNTKVHVIKEKIAVVIVREPLNR